MNYTNPSDMSYFYPPIEGGLFEHRFESICLKEWNPPLYPHQVSIERIDDIPLLLALQKRIHLDSVIDSAIPRHWSHQGLSIGQLVMGWNTFILSQGDHRKVTVRSWVTHHQKVLEEQLGHFIRDTDFTDDRLGQVLTALSDDQAWQAIEAQLWCQTVYVYSITPQCVRLDATTASGHHTVEKESLMQFGYNKDHPNQPQVKVMAGSIDSQSNGHLVAIEVVSGQNADDSLYQPVLKRMRDILQHESLLYMGDSKMSALATRADIVGHGDFYLVPLAEVGEIPKLLSDCIEKVVFGNQPMTLIYAPNKNPEKGDLLNAVVSSPTPEAGLRQPLSPLAAGYETSRPMNYTFPNGESIAWTERLLVIRSLSEAEKERALLFKRLVQAEHAILALTPEPKRGRQQIRREDQLHQEALTILEQFGVLGLLTYTFEREESTKTQYIGRGRGGKNREQRTVTSVRYVITKVQRDESAIAATTWRMGFRLYATNQLATELSLTEAYLLYRQAPRIERHFHLFKDAPVGLEPLYVRRDDQIKGLIRLLSLCVRLLTLIEIVARRNLWQQGEKLSGLFEGNPKQQTDQPTAIRLLKAFRYVNRVQLVVAGQHIRYPTPLSPLQRQILALLELDETFYETSFQNSG